ncbi:reverse transcriptase [Pyrenophora tritici-repentis]|nr:reverse transcriptase [Pyrenophora tritici-repentis]KAI1663283.1 reverse transcriptase [Pyrenophora tritici-repentis]KAI1663307.1 reverse transcriptase [Pyrenophora tritici-repentis]
MEEWRPELQGADLSTEILTDHKNLEYFTTTKVLSQRQIIYRPGARAIRPDALSRKLGDRPDMADQSDDRLKNRHRTLLPPERFDPEALHDMMADSDLRAAPIELITPAHSEPIDDVTTRAYERNDVAQQLIAAIQDPTAMRWPKNLRKQVRVPMIDCRVHNSKLFYRDRLYAPADDELRSQIVYRAHSSGPAGHPGRVKTLDLITRTWWWPGMSRDIEQYVKACDLCVRSKASRLAPQGFLQPLPLPYRAWSDVSVDYITPLPKSTWYSRIYQHLLVVVCRLTKMRHLIPVTSLNADELADTFVSRVYCLHGCPDNIVSDRGTQFVSEFWTQLSQRLGVTLKHSSSFHPETNSQTERVNSSIEAYLRAFMNFHQDDWVQWLPLAEFAMNNVISETTGVSPFFANYGYNPQLGIEPSKPAPPNLSMAQKQQFYRANAVADRFERIITQLKALLLLLLLFH